MSKPRAKARTIYHSAELVEAIAAKPVKPADLIKPADRTDEQMLAHIHEITIMGQGE
jgi:hypothetical protein